MKLTLEINGIKNSVETEATFVCMEEYFRFFTGLLVAAGWNQETINELNK